MDNTTPPSPDLRDRRVTLRDQELAQKLGDLILIGKRFAFMKPGWMGQALPGMEQWGLSPQPVAELNKSSAIVFLGEKEVALPGASVAGQSFAKPDLISLTSDKALYRVGTESVRLLVASPQRPHAELQLTLRLSGSHYANYTVTLDAYGLCLRALAGLPEGEYEARLEGTEASVCRFEVAQYRLAPLTADLVEQVMENSTLNFTLLLQAFGQPYTGEIEIELQERGQRVGKRQQRHTDKDGHCTGSVELTGAGPYTLNIIAGERTATVALKGSEQERREVITISELGNIQELSLLPLPGGEVCRALSIASRGQNTSPFLVSEVIGEEIQLVARAGADLVRAVMYSPATGEVTEHLQEQVAAGTKLTLKTPAPYGLLLVGAFIKGKPWEGWCVVVRPSDLNLAIFAPKQARPGKRVTITLRTDQPERAVPVQMIVKDQRLIAPGDPQVELAARIKATLPDSSKGAWKPGEPSASLYAAGFDFPTPILPVQGSMSMPSALQPMRSGIGFPPTMPMPAGPRKSGNVVRRLAEVAAAAPVALAQTALTRREDGASQAAPKAQTANTSMLTPIRVEFPEVIHNSLVSVTGQAEVTIKLGDSLTNYTIEAFALDGLDWVRQEAQLEAQLPAYGELVLSPFVFPGDQVSGTLHVGAASGRAHVEVLHDGDPVPLWVDGRRLELDEEVKSGTT
ncbi:MAG TPA: hypothetical protein VFN35_25240, partial [Ktedonobacteraceae bacterium]|nr:hypothetical protein [Ktedonobacteraceae bacterium]